MSSFLRSDHDGIIDFVFNRPDKLNAINHETMEGLWQAVSDLRLHPEHRVLLIRATGRYFCAGVDLAEAQRGRPTKGGTSVHRSWFRSDMIGRMQSLWQEMEMVEKPIVVAHHAMCMGGGLELSLSCDFRLAARSASYAFPEMKMGMVPLSGGLSRLTRLCGPHWSKWLVLANEEVTAKRALIMGLVHDIYEDECFEQKVREFCLRLASLPPEAVALGKTAVEMAADLDSTNARQLERIVYGSLISGEENQRLERTHKAKVLKKDPA